MHIYISRPISNHPSIHPSTCQSATNKLTSKCTYIYMYLEAMCIYIYIYIEMYMYTHCISGTTFRGPQGKVAKLAVVEVTPQDDRGHPTRSADCHPAPSFRKLLAIPKPHTPKQRFFYSPFGYSALWVWGISWRA